MERIDFEKIYTLANVGEQLKLKILWEALVENMKAFKVEGRQKNLKLWQEAEKALDHKAAELRAKYLNRAPSYENRLAVFKHLKSEGYKIGQQKVYADVEKGFLTIEEDGTILHAEAERYATTLVKVSDGNGSGELTVGAEKKQAAEIRQIQERTKSIILDRDIKAGKFVMAAEVETEQAVKAAAFKAGLYHLFDTRFRDCLVIAGGDPKKTAAAIEFWRPEIEQLLDDFSRLDEIEVQVGLGNYEVN